MKYPIGLLAPKMRLVLVLAAVVGVAGCGGPDSGTATPTSPTQSSSSSGSSSSTSASLFFGFADPFGTYTVNFRGQTYTAGGPFTVSLAPGAYEMSGTYTGGTFIVTFGSVLPQGGVQSGSVRSTLGQVNVTQACGIAYSEVPQTTQSFRLQFTVTSNMNSAC